MTPCDFRLYAVPSFWEGVARLMDMMGMLNEYNYSNTPVEADYRAIWSDWVMVRQDLMQAVVQFKRQHRE
jgi:hypothetical protein